MTEEERKAAELTAEVFAETFMWMVKQRLRLAVNAFANGDGTVNISVSLLDSAAKVKSDEYITGGTATLKMGFK